ncbi:MAG: hypothetical protein ACRDY7_06945, partial [Acidimicrobiia bacterium]
GATHCPDRAGSPAYTPPVRAAGQRFLRQHGPALGGYAALTALFFWPVVRHFPTRVLSDGGDGAFYLWNMWAIPRAALDGANPFFTDDLFHPYGAHTAFNTNIPFLGVASAPLQWAFGLAVTANLLQLGALVASGFGAYLLALRVCGDRRAAFVAGAAFAFAPYRFEHYAQFSLHHTELIPFGLLALLRLYERPTRGRAMAFGALAGVTFLTDLYYTVFLGLAAVVVAAWRWRETRTRQVAIRLVQAGGVAALVGLPLLGAMVVELTVHETLDPLTNWANADNLSADLLSWVVPSDISRLWGERFVAINAEVTGGDRVAFAGFGILALAAVGLAAGTRGRRGLWAATAGVFGLLALGPFLHVNGNQGDTFARYNIRFDVPLPYYLLHSVPVLNGVRVPGRFSIVAILALDVLAALGLTRLGGLRQGRGRGRSRDWGRGWALPAAALAVVVVECFPKYVLTQAAAIPRPYHALADQPGDEAVLEIPLQWRTGFGAYGDRGGDHTIFMYYATRHGKPLVGGMVARYPDRDLRRIMTEPVYSEVLALQDTSSGTAGTYTATFTAADLADLGVGWVVYHRDRPRPRARAYLSELDMPVLADDGTVVIWEVPDRAGPAEPVRVGS